MLPRCFVVCTLLLAPSLAGIAQSLPNLLHVGRNILLAPDKEFRNATAFSAPPTLRAARPAACAFSPGMFSSTARWAATFWSSAATLHSPATPRSTAAWSSSVDTCTRTPPRSATPSTVLAPIIFLPMILGVCVIIGGLIVLTRRMVRGPVAFPPLPRLIDPRPRL